jgi:hypothetical protein
MKSIRFALFLIALSSSPLAGAQPLLDKMFASTEYTLYRTGVDLSAKVHDETLRIHVATFDSTNDANYNLANCEFAQELFNASQPHHRGNIYGSIKIKYWCEKGRFRK